MSHRRQFQRNVADKSQTQFLFIFGLLSRELDGFMVMDQAALISILFFAPIEAKFSYLKCGENVSTELDCVLEDLPKRRK